MNIDKEEYVKKINQIKEFYPELIVSNIFEMSLKEMKSEYQTILNKIDDVNQENGYQQYRNYAVLIYESLHINPGEERKWEEVFDFIYDNIHDDDIDMFIDKISEIFSPEEARKLAQFINQIKQNTINNATKNTNEIFEMVSDKFIMEGLSLFILDSRFKSYLKKEFKRF